MKHINPSSYYLLKTKVKPSVLEPIRTALQITPSCFKTISYFPSPKENKTRHMQFSWYIGLLIFNLSVCTEQTVIINYKSKPL